jgi:hypothetical protein
VVASTIPCVWEKRNVAWNSGTSTNASIKIILYNTDNFENYFALDDISFSQAAMYGGGSGTAEDPYQISSKEDLFVLAATPDDYCKHFVLTKDIDLSYDILAKALIAPDTDIRERHFQGVEFTGVFDGKGHAISNLHIISNNPEDHEGHYGLFGVISEGGQVSRLLLQNVNIQANSSNSVGGLVASNRGTIFGCCASGIVSGRVGVGVLVGENCLGTISQCYASGDVYVSYASGGAVVGQNNGLVEQCYAKDTNVIGTGEYSHFLGILVGENESETALIINCYSDGILPLAGINADGILTNCYATGGGEITPEVPWEPITVLNCFWDTGIDGDVIVSEYGTGLPTIHMRQLTTYQDVGWDFTNEILNGNKDIWRMCTSGISYPRLNWESRKGDFSCPDGINTEDLNYYAGHWLMNNCTSTNNYCGGADLNYSGVVGLADFAIFAENWLLEI